jgi:hypothetical protein
VEEATSQLEQLTTQGASWQEKALAFESDAWELNLRLEGKDRKLKDGEKERKFLQKEIDILRS